MNSLFRCSRFLTLAAVLGVVSTAGCTPQDTASGGEANAMSSMQEGTLVHDGQELFGHYERPEPFPQPLPDDAHSHDGWTMGVHGSGLCRDPGQNLDRDAGRTPASGRGSSLDTLRPPERVPRERLAQ